MHPSSKSSVPISSDDSNFAKVFPETGQKFGINITRFIFQDDIYFASSQMAQLEDQNNLVDLKRRHINVKYRNTQQTHTSTTSEQQIRIYKMSLNSIQKLSLDRSPATKQRLPNVRTPLSPFNEVSFDFAAQTSTHDSDSSFEETQEHEQSKAASLSTHNLNRPYSWAVLDLDDTSTKLDNEFRELIECHQGEINCI